MLRLILSTALAGLAAAVSSFSYPNQESELVCGIGPAILEPVEDPGQSPPSTSVGPLPPSVLKSLQWLAAAQHPDGGWGGGSHARQDIRNPHEVPTDPATTAFTAMAFLRSGHTPYQGPYQDVVRRAVAYLLGAVEQAPKEGPRITHLTGTQPQAKMGPFVDTALAAQLFSRLLPETAADPVFQKRVQTALDKCLRKIASSQDEQGHWGGGGWAPVLQSSLMSNALEMAQAAGRKIDRSVLDRARQYQKDQVEDDGTVNADAAAGVTLYASSGNQRAVAGEARAAEDKLEQAKREGKVSEDAEVSVESLVSAGLPRPEAQELELSFRLNEQAKQRAFDDAVLSGFGNNGGEEYLSHAMTAESLVIDGGEEWQRWQSKMQPRFEKVQNPDGSYSGHHCITSPVFCTAAVVLCLTAERDAELLRKSSDLTPETR